MEQPNSVTLTRSALVLTHVTAVISFAILTYAATASAFMIGLCIPILGWLMCIGIIGWWMVAHWVWLVAVVLAAIWGLIQPLPKT